MILVITIPAYNEEQTISQVIQDIPRQIAGISEVKILVINDGSTDNTIQEAQNAGADFIISNTANLGLAVAFKKGINKALELGADIIVNIDGDGQHEPKDIPKLVQPIVQNQADLVLGYRQINSKTKMPWGNKYGNMIGNWVIGRLIKMQIKDASSGFRAFSKECALRLNFFSRHTYTHETLIQTAFNGLTIRQIPITFYPRKYGKSKLVKTISSHIINSLRTIIKTIIIYRPFKFFLYLGILVFLAGAGLEVRFLILRLVIHDTGVRFPSLLLSAILNLSGTMIIIFGVLAGLLSVNRSNIQEQLYLMKKYLLRNKNRNKGL